MLIDMYIKLKWLKYVYLSADELSNRPLLIIHPFAISDGRSGLWMRVNPSVYPVHFLKIHDTDSGY